MAFHLFIQDILIDHILIVRYYITTGDIKINDIVFSMEVKKMYKVELYFKIIYAITTKWLKAIGLWRGGNAGTKTLTFWPVTEESKILNK